MYDAFPWTADGLPIDNLHEVAVNGRCRIVQQANAKLKTQFFLSKELSSPTWLDVCVVADDLLRQTNDMRWVFLEALTILRHEDGVAVVELDFGS